MASSKRRERDAVFQDEFREDLRHWVDTDRRVALRVLDLVEAIMRDPFQGIGRPEPLKHMGANVWSLIAPAMSRPSLAGIEEDYTLSVVRRFDRPVIAEALRGEVDLAALLAHESRPLSAGAKRDLLRHAYSWYEDDLVAITWDHAFVYDPNGGDEDIADVLEVANVQLLEMRYYDDVLDAELPRMYERVQQARGRFGGLARTRYANLARALQTLVAEVVELTERVDNALIVTEDTYLARIYGAGVDLFRVQTWAGAVNRKLSLIRETYTTLYDEAATARAEYLEAAIVLLIVFEIVMALL